MTQSITREIAALSHMTVTELRSKHIEVFGERTKSGHKEYLVRRIAWRIQANAWGDLSERAKLRAGELANDADLRVVAPKIQAATASHALTRQTAVTFNHDSRLPMPGAILRRKYKDRELVVQVLPRGFEWEGTVYPTLSAVAKAVTGSHWNGYRFFNLNQNGDDDE